MEGQNWKQNVYYVEWSTELNEWINEWMNEKEKTYFYFGIHILKIIISQKSEMREKWS